MADWKLPAYIERQYERALTRIAKEVAKNFDAINGGGYKPQTTQSWANRYAELLNEFANSTAGRMAYAVKMSNKRQWAQYSDYLSQLQKQQIEGATGRALNMWLENQRMLIRSIPIKSAEALHEKATENLYKGERADSLMDILKSVNGMTQARAKTIARTETGRAQTELVKVQAESIGSEGYVWRTAHDGDVRPSHKAMDGKFVRWDEPPTLDGMRGHAGALPNCRCLAEPLFEFDKKPAKAGREMYQPPKPVNVSKDTNPHGTWL